MSDTQRLPNLYQLLGLTGPENNLERISASLKRAQAKVDALKGDAARAADAARLQKVIALGQKYLLSADLKANYDAQWHAIYGSAPVAVDQSKVAKPSTATRAAVAAPQTVAASPTAVALADSTVATSELSWDMSSLDALLPTADPHAPFQMADYLRTSQVRDPLAAEADLRKLISLLGGEVAEASDGASAAPLATGQPQWHSGTDVQESASVDTGVSMPRSTGTPAAAVALAKRMRQKRQRAMLLGGTALTAAVGGLVLLSFYLNRPAPKVAQAPAVPIPTSPPPVTLPNEPAGASNNTETNQAATPTVNPNSTVLIQPGENVKPMEIQATPLPKPDAMAMADKPAAEPMKPETPQPESPKPVPEPAKPEPAKPDPAKPDSAKPDPAKPDPQATKPEVTKPAEMPADVKLTDKEKKVWQDDMKRVRAGLSKLDPATSEQQIEALKALAKTGEQRTQLSTLEQAVGLVRKAREALVAGIGSLESGETFMVGNSTEVAFVEGDETRIIVRIGGRKEYKLEAIPAAMGLVLMKMKPNVVDANLEAAMGAYIMVQTKKNNAATAQGKKLLEDAAAAGAISKELAQFHEEDYKLP